jgi:hypothetical protein
MSTRWDGTRPGISPHAHLPIQIILSCLKHLRSGREHDEKAASETCGDYLRDQCQISASGFLQISRDTDRLRRMSIIEEGLNRRSGWQYLAIVGSHSVNGVSQLHTQLLSNGW